MSNNKYFEVLLIDSNAESKPDYIERFKEIPFCRLHFSATFLPVLDLINLKKVDAILFNIKNIPDDIAKDFNLIKKQFKDSGIPAILFRTKSKLEVIPDSIINTSFIADEAINLSKLITDLKEFLLHDGGDSSQFINSPLNEVPDTLVNKRGAESNELNQQRSVFIRNIIYEVRTLLNNVGAPIQLIKERIDDPELIPLFGVIDTTLSRMVEFTFKASLSSDLKLGNYPIKKKMINLEEIVRFSVLELSEFLEFEKIKIDVKSPSSKTMLYGDKDLLFHGISAILDKTINLTKENGEITIDFDVFDDRISCKINSNSFTLPKGSILEVFNSSSIEQEIGLGLAKMALNIHDANYWVDLANEKGVTIGITFKISEHE